MMIAVLSLFFSLNSNAQVFDRTEVVNGVTVQIYKATVLVDLARNNSKQLKKAYEERAIIYGSIKQIATEAASSRVVSQQNLSTRETKNSFDQKFNETVQVTSAADVTIKPISESRVGKTLKTDIEIWVSPVKTAGVEVALTQPMLSNNELFQKLKVEKNQKYLLTIKQDILFDKNESSAGLCPDSDRRISLLRKSSRDIMLFVKGSFVVTLNKIVDHSSINPLDSMDLGDWEWRSEKHAYLFKFKRGGEKFNLYTGFDHDRLSTEKVADVLRSFNSCDKAFVLTPLFSFSPRVMDVAQKL